MFTLRLILISTSLKKKEAIYENHYYNYYYYYYHHHCKTEEDSLSSTPYHEYNIKFVSLNPGYNQEKVK